MLTAWLWLSRTYTRVQTASTAGEGPYNRRVMHVEQSLAKVRTRVYVPQQCALRFKSQALHLTCKLGGPHHHVSRLAVWHSAASSRAGLTCSKWHGSMNQTVAGAPLCMQGTRASARAARHALCDAQTPIGLHHYHIHMAFTCRAASYVLTLS